MVIALILVLAAIVFLIITINKRSQKDRIEPPPSKLIINESYVPESVPVVNVNTPMEQNHVIDVIYTYPEESGLWKCPNCECENAMYTTSCSVCNRSR